MCPHPVSSDSEIALGVTGYPVVSFSHFIGNWRNLPVLGKI
jgi:hypothetical protein